MAFYIGQLQKNSDPNNSGTYMTSIIDNITDVIVSSPNPFKEAANSDGLNSYSDFALALNGKFQMGQVYYLRFKIHKVPLYYYSGQVNTSMFPSSSWTFSQADVLNFRLLLKNNDQLDEEKDPPEQIGSFTVPQSLPNESDAYASYSFIFTPSKEFDRLVFRLSRIGFDELIHPRNWLIEQLKEGEDAFNPLEEEEVERFTGTGTIKIKVKGVRINHGQQVIQDDSIVETGLDGDTCILNNILPLSKASEYWIKLGYQSRPGSLIVVNKEPIRVGRSGIYELNNGTKIENFMIASPNGSNNEKIDAFLLDYAYTK